MRYIKRLSWILKAPLAVVVAFIAFFGTTKVMDLTHHQLGFLGISDNRELTPSNPVQHNGVPVPPSLSQSSFGTSNVSLGKNRVLTKGQPTGPQVLPQAYQSRSNSASLGSPNVQSPNKPLASPMNAAPHYFAAPVNNRNFGIVPANKSNEMTTSRANLNFSNLVGNRNRFNSSNSVANQLVRQLNAANTGVRPQGVSSPNIEQHRFNLKARLREELLEEFAFRHHNQQQRIAVLEEQLVNAKKLHKRRAENREAIVDRRIAQLLDEVDDLAWDAPIVGPNPPLNANLNSSQLSIPTPPPTLGNSLNSPVPSAKPSSRGLVASQMSNLPSSPPQLPPSSNPAPGTSQNVLPFSVPSQPEKQSAENDLELLPNSEPSQTDGFPMELARPEVTITVVVHSDGKIVITGQGENGFRYVAKDVSEFKSALESAKSDKRITRNAPVELKCLESNSYQEVKDLIKILKEAELGHIVIVLRPVEKTDLGETDSTAEDPTPTNEVGAEPSKNESIPQLENDTTESAPLGSSEFETVRYGTLRYEGLAESVRHLFPN